MLAAVSFGTFALLDLTPGDAAQTLIGESASADELARLRHELGLDLSLFDRYGRFAAAAVLHQDLGRSVISGRPVAPMVGERFRYTLTLALAASALALAIGVTAGTVAAARPGGLADLAVMAGAAAGLAVPSFWLALMLILVFAVRLRWLPVLGDGSGAHLIMPAVSLSLPTAAVFARLVRASLLDIKGADFVRTAAGKGLPKGRIWRDHIGRNSLVPLVTMFGLNLGHLLGGTFIIETAFSGLAWAASSCGPCWSGITRSSSPRYC